MSSQKVNVRIFSQEAVFILKRSKKREQEIGCWHLFIHLPLCIIGYVKVCKGR